MLCVKDLLATIKGMDKSARICLKVKGERKRFDLTGAYGGYLNSGQPFIAFHNQSDDTPITIASLLSYTLTGNELLLYDNSVECNLITYIKVEKNKVVLCVDIFNDIVQPRY